MFSSICVLSLCSCQCASTETTTVVSLRTACPLWWAQASKPLGSLFAASRQDKLNSGFFACSLWWAQVDSNNRPHAYQACALTNWAMSPHGGGKRDRTDDPLLARQVLSQLSYTPMYLSEIQKAAKFDSFNMIPHLLKLVKWILTVF